MNIKYTIKNLDCADCALKLESHLKRTVGFEDASVNFVTSTLNVSSSNIEKLQRVIQDVEPDVTLSLSKEFSDIRFNPVQLIKEHTQDLLMIILSSVLLVILIVNEQYFHANGKYLIEYLLAGVAFLLCGYSVLSQAVKTIIKRDYFDENVLMSIASIGAFAVHALEEAIGVMIFYQIGELLQTMAVKRSRGAIQKLLEIRPDYANVKTCHGIKKVSPQDVATGDILLVKPGEKIPLDAIIIEGHSTIDTTVLTGESVPSEVTAGNTVLAGEINLTGQLTLKVTKPFSESSVSKILDMVENASEKKAKAENFVTSFAKVYTPIIVSIAILVAIIPPLFIQGQLFSTWVYRALVLLVISCPCALVISIPLGYFGGIGGASRRGILIKGSGYIDILAKVKHVVFDKTGTLTKGSFDVLKVDTLNGIDLKELMFFAATLESQSNHPIARSIVKFYNHQYGHLENTDIINLKEIHGGGIKAIINNKTITAGNAYLMKREGIDFKECDSRETVLYIAIDATVEGIIHLGDEIKDDAKEALEKLHKNGISDIVMLTGDNRSAAQLIAEKLSITKFHANLLPENKVEILEEIVNRNKNGSKVAFVGDGINDAPVLARADVGIAMGALGSDAAIETADVVLMTDHPSKVADAIGIARKTRSIVIQNIVMSLGVKTVVLLLGVAGFASMWAAVFADVGVALLAVVNASRALRFKD